MCRIRGFEFDLNPIDIYEYSDMIDNMSNFMTGLNVGYNITPPSNSTCRF